ALHNARPLTPGSHGRRPPSRSRYHAYLLLVWVDEGRDGPIALSAETRSPSRCLSATRSAANQRANSTVEGPDRCAPRRRTRAFGPFESARRSRRPSARPLDRAASSVRGRDRSRNSDGIPRRSPGDRRAVERFSMTCLSQWRSRRLRHQQASPRSNPRRLGMAFCAESCKQCRQKRIDVGGLKTEPPTNLARRCPLRDQLECVSLPRRDLQNRTAPDSEVDLGSRERRQEFPLVNHQRECFVAKRTPPVRRLNTALD